MNDRDILQFLQYNPMSSRAEIAEGIHFEGSDATLKRIIASNVASENITVVGKGKATRYILANKCHIMMPVDLDTYFVQDQDQRQVQTSFNFNLLSDLLPSVKLFTDDEKRLLDNLQSVFLHHMDGMSPTAYQKEMERLGVDLSWKSSQIEGNTYSLLETERLLRESKTAEGKTQEEAIMLLNHKQTLRFLLENRDYLHHLTIRRIEDIQSMLVDNLNTDKGFRHRRVGITGTNYRPLDNEFQIREAMEATCNLVNNCENVFEKALIAILMISYIQPFTDGNKRTARLVSNGILLSYGYCPLSFRTVDSIDYKKAMLIFYEQNYITPFKQIFVEQYRFAVGEYF